ncbi:hypothetical protein [Sphingomonas solaris]|uniref:Uncharacterized protein n=1 Tax=Alterirhizorhabdus solaris TaxID=2529389 RepID=A0A558RCP3_9SPHN|nr:hypothetical protein [Sphingomonas solaris]TVV77247.1 hypothetical protein FOY91_01550 [Sphingomonas solaris]
MPVRRRSLDPDWPTIEAGKALASQHDAAFGGVVADRLDPVPAGGEDRIDRDRIRRPTEAALEQQMQIWRADLYCGPASRGSPGPSTACSIVLPKRCYWPTRADAVEAADDQRAGSVRYRRISSGLAAVALSEWLRRSRSRCVTRHIHAGVAASRQHREQDGGGDGFYPVLTGRASL